MSVSVSTSSAPLRKYRVSSPVMAKPVFAIICRKPAAGSVSGGGAPSPSVGNCG